MNDKDIDVNNNCKLGEGYSNVKFINLIDMKRTDELSKKYHSVINN